MKKTISAIAICFIIILSFGGCSNNKNATSTTSNAASNTTPKATDNAVTQTTAQTKPQTTNETAAEKEARLEKTAQKGYDLFFAKEYSEAIATEDSVIAEDPTFFKAYYIKGITQCYSGKYAEGSKNIDKALELSPDDYMARFNKALSLELYAHYDEALVWYQKSIDISKGEWSYYGIASIYGRRGDVADTVEYLKLAIDIDPDIRNYAKTEKDFNNVKNSKEFKQLIGE